MISMTFTAGDDFYVATLNDTYILDFLAGHDRLVIKAGSVTATMGDGNDFVRVDSGTAVLYGQNGADRFDVYSNGARINAGADNDILNIRGGSGHLITGRSGDDRFNFLSDASEVRLHGDEGNDLFVGYSRSISGNLFGGAGNDRFLNFGNHEGRTVTLYGGSGNDLYRLDSDSPANIVENAGEGTDTVQVARGVDYTLGANVENLAVLDSGPLDVMGEIVGNASANRLTGGNGQDTLRGLGGNDQLSGGAGSDFLYGGDGDDIIYGGTGLDYIESGAGSDIIVYKSIAEPASDGPYSEVIADWTSADRIDLSAIDANSTVDGNQAFNFAGEFFGTPVPDQPAASVALAGFGGELYVIIYVDDVEGADMVISLGSAEGEAGLTFDNIIP